MQETIKGKQCSKCHEVKPLAEFGVKKYNKDGLNHYCKPCENNRSKSRYEKPEVKESRKYYQIFKLYGLTREQYNKKLEQQNFKCQICANELLNDKNTHIDHCHGSGRVRDILCSDCNRLLGIVKENVNYLTDVIAYLRKHRVE